MTKQNNLFDSYYDVETPSISFGFEFAPPRASDYNKILSTVYTEMSRGKKETFGSKIAKKAIAKDKHSLGAEVLDPTYSDAVSEVKDLYSRLFRNFVGLYSYIDDERKNLIGFTSFPGLVLLGHDDSIIRDGVDKNHPFVVHDIYVVDADGYEKDPKSSFDVVYNVYNLFLERLEEIASSAANSDDIVIDFRTSANNGTLLSALSNRGYEVGDSGDLDTEIRFTKTVTKREDVNEGNNSRK